MLTLCRLSGASINTMQCMPVTDKYRMSVPRLNCTTTCEPATKSYEVHFLLARWL